MPLPDGYHPRGETAAAPPVLDGGHPRRLPSLEPPSPPGPGGGGAAEREQPPPPPGPPARQEGRRARPRPQAGRQPEPDVAEKHGRLGGTMHAINGMTGASLFDGELPPPPLPPPAPPPTVSRLLRRAQKELAERGPPEWQRPRSAPAAKILIETYHPATRKAVLSDWKLLEEPAEAAADEETLQAISQREAAEAGRRMLEQGGGAETGGGGGGGGGGGVVGDVSADAEHTWLKLPRGRSHMGGQQPMGYVRGFKAYHLRSIRHTSGTLD
jgi:hypothetical protein